jgi:diguanylate cyclase (GGDEF)-like protein
MPALDLRTVIFLSGAIGALMSLVFYFMHRSHRQSIQGLRDWAIAPLLLFISTLMLGTQGVAPAWFSIVLANLMLMSGLSLFFSGACRFYNLPPTRWPWLAMVVATPLLYWWAEVSPNYGGRLVTVHTFTAAIQAHTFLIVWRHDRTSLAARFTLAVLGIMAALSVTRILTSPLIPQDAHLFTSTALQNLFVGTYGFLVLALTVGFVLLISDRLREQLQHLLSHDALTGVLSRRALFDQALNEVRRAQRTLRPFSVMVMDLDHFKAINDTHGHLMGDRVLQNFVVRVKPALRQTDLIGRYGGEEFVVVLPETDAAMAHAVAERILHHRTANPGTVPVTVSIGVVTQQALSPQPSAHEILENLIHRADQALYQAKSTGRDRIVVAEPAP